MFRLSSERRSFAGVVAVGRRFPRSAGSVVIRLSGLHGGEGRPAVAARIVSMPAWCGVGQHEVVGHGLYRVAEGGG
jgi:hypothetical protein